MIFSVQQSPIPQFQDNIYLVVETYGFQDVIDLYDMLKRAFPNDNTFTICCFGGYDNAIGFRRSKR